MFMTPSEFNFVACLRQELDQFSARTTSSDWLLLPPLRPRLRFLTHRTVEEVSSGLLQTRSVGVGDQRRTVVYCSQSSGRMEVSRESAVSTQACASPPLLTGGMERPGERRALRAPRAPIAVYVPPGRRSSSTTATTAEKASTQSKAKSRGSSDSAASTGTSSTTVAVAEKSKPSMQSKARSSRGSSDSAASIGDSLSAAAAAEKSKPSTQRKAKSSRGSSASTTSTMPSLSKTKPPDVPAAATVAAACVTEPSTASAECDSRHAAKKTRQSGSKAPPKKSLPKDEEREDTRPVERRRKKKSDKAAEPVEDWETAEVDDLLAQMDMGAASACVTRPSRDLLAASSIEDIFYDTDEFGHVLEVYDFDSSADSKFINQAVLSVSINNNFHIKWVDDTHCLASFSSQHAARDALSLVLRGGCGIQMRPLSQASEASRAVAARSFDTDFMAQTSEPRPAKTAMVARRMISSALNTKIPVSQEARDKERQTLKDAREKKKEVAKKKADVWGSD